MTPLNKYTRALLPNYFKMIGIAVVIAAAATVFILKPFIKEADPETKEFAKVALFNFIILGVFLFAWAGNKIEDEMTLQVRLKAVLASFIFVIGYVFIYPFISYFAFRDNEAEVSAQQAILTMLIIFIMANAGMRKQLDNEK